METFSIENLCHVHIYGDTSRSLPVVYIHTFEGEGEQVWQECQKMQTRRHILVEIAGLDWDASLTPWPTGRLFKNDAPCPGLGAQWLQALTSRVIPAVEARLQPATRRLLAGYSLAGMYAIWAAYNTDAFDGLISGSGSFWYPDFIDYVKTHEFKKVPSCIYFSLGDKETRLKNAVLNTVEERTRWLCDHYQAMGINTVFQLNNGNHYQQPAWRMARGITWALRQPVAPQR